MSWKRPIKKKKLFAYLNTLERSRKFRIVQKDDEGDKDE